MIDVVERLAKRYESVGGKPIDEFTDETVRWWLNAIADEMKRAMAGFKPSTGWDSAIIWLRDQSRCP